MSYQSLREYDSLPEEYRKQVDDFISFLKTKLTDEKGKKQTTQKRKLGFAKGKAKMADDFEVTEHEKNILEDRLAEYHKNPRGGKSLDKVVKTLGKKHGFKNSY